MFSASWKAPSFEAPSPKKQTTTRSVPCSFMLRPAPTDIGKPPPTTPLAPRLPSERSAMCIEPPAAAADARLFGQQLGHHRAHVLALANGVGMAAMRRDDDIVRPQGRDGADAHCFLPGAQVHGAVHLAQGVLLVSRFLKDARELHLV